VESGCADCRVNDGEGKGEVFLFDGGCQGGVCEGRRDCGRSFVRVRGLVLSWWRVGLGNRFAGVEGEGFWEGLGAAE